MNTIEFWKGKTIFLFKTISFEETITFFYSIDRQSCYMVRSDELYNEVTNDSSGKGASQGMAIGCFIDIATGLMSFTCEGKETSFKFKVKYIFFMNVL